MPAGTIALTNGSATVTGTGTAFTNEFKTGDFLGVVVGGVPYTLIVSGITSDTSLTAAANFTGPTTSGLAWYAVPATLQTAITQQAMNDMSKVIRSMIQDKANWQGFYTGTGNTTIKLPDGTSVTGPSWPSMQKTLNDGMTSKANSGANDDITSLAGLTTALSIAQGGTGAKTAAAARNALGVDYGTVAGTAAQGNDSRITGALQRSGGTVTGPLYANGQLFAGDQVTSSYKGTSFSSTKEGAVYSGGNTYNLALAAVINNTQYIQMDAWNDSNNVYARIVTWNTNPKVFRFMDNGNGICDGQWISGSDERHKSNIKLVPDALRAVLSWRGCTYDKKDGLSEVGLIAQDVEKDCPLAVIDTGERKYSDGSVIEDFKSLNVAGVSAAYHTEAIKSLFGLVELALVDPDKALASIDSIKKALNDAS